jgi:DNA-binding CsgD family transcriptional regulator
MSRLGPVERTTFLAIRAECAAGLDSVTLRERVARHITRYLQADAYCAMELDPATTLPVHDVNYGWPRGYVEPLADALFRSKTADTGFLARQRRRAIILDQLLEGAAHQTDPYFRGHVLPFGYRHEIQFMCVSGGMPRALFTFNRRAARGAFEPRHLRLLEAVAPHVGTAVHAACVRAALRERPGTESGFVVLGAGGDIELASATGRRLLDRLHTPQRPLALAVFLQLLRRSLRDGADPAVNALSFTDPGSHQTYRLLAERTVGADGHARAAILIEPARPLDSHLGLLRLGLTAREAEAASAVLLDDNLHACASRLGCAPATVTRHLKTVFRKLSVGSRRELALRLMASAPNLGSGPAGLP